MDERGMWDLFLETGVPEYYLLYRAMRTEAGNVSEDKRACSQGNAL